MGKNSRQSNYLPIRDYEKIALYTIHKLGYKYQWMLKSEDAISEIIYNVALGDSRYKEIGSRKGYRMSNANYAARTINSNKKNFVYLDQTKEGKYGEFNLHKIIGNRKDIDPADLTIYREIVSYIETAEELTNHEKTTLQMFFIQNASQSEIAKQLQVTQQRISQYVESGLSKLRTKFNTDNESVL